MSNIALCVNVILLNISFSWEILYWRQCVRLTCLILSCGRLSVFSDGQTTLLKYRKYKKTNTTKNSRLLVTKTKTKTKTLRKRIASNPCRDVRKHRAKLGKVQETSTAPQFLEDYIFLHCLDFHNPSQLTAPGPRTDQLIHIPA